MLSRSAVVIPLAKRAMFSNVPSVTNMALRLCSHGPPAHYKIPTMDDMILPCGSWQENYNNNQRRYNLHLLVGIGFFTITFIFGYASGVFNLYVTYPLKPGPRK